MNGGTERGTRGEREGRKGRSARSLEWVCNSDFASKRYTNAKEQKKKSHLVLMSREACVVPVVDLTFVADHGEQVVFVHRVRARISAPSQQVPNKRREKEIQLCLVLYRYDQDGTRTKSPGWRSLSRLWQAAGSGSSSRAS